MNNVVKPVTKNCGFYNTRIQFFGDEFVKTTCCSKPIFNGDRLEPRKNPDAPKQDKPKNMDNPVSEKSVKRAQDKVQQIAYANDFRWFVTLTLNPAKVERFDADDVKKKLSIWLKHKVERQNLKYLLVPEYHSDKAIHFHGLMSGDLDMKDSGTVSIPGRKKPMNRHKAKRLGLEGHTVYNLENWIYGFTTAVEIYGSRAACINYFVKYITKDSKKVFGKFYLAGGGVVRKVPTKYERQEYAEFEAQIETRLDEYKIGFKYRFDDKEGFTYGDEQN